MLFRFDDFDQTFAWMDDLHRRLDRMLGDARTSDQARSLTQGWLDLHETPEELVVQADLPGVRDEDLEISLENDVFTLSGHRAVDVPEGHRVHLRERKPYRFTRSFVLPVRVDPDAVVASLSGGVLTVKMRKAPEVKPRQISVNAN